MSARPRAARRIACASLLAAGLSPLLSSQALAAEIVSRASGPSGLPFPSSLIDASANGRYVVLGVGASNATPATEPEATVTSPTGVVIRDRVALTTVPVSLPDPATGVQRIRGVGAISDDGDRLLVGVREPGVTNPEAPVTLAVFERSTGTLLSLPTLNGAPTGTRVVSAEMSSDGLSALLSTVSASDSSASAGIFRGPIGGTATRVLDLPGARVSQASDDLSTFIYARTLGTVPSADSPALPFTGQVYGVKQGDGAPRVIAEDQRKVTAEPDWTGKCATVLRTWSFTQPRLSGDGGRVALSYRRTDPTSSIPQTGASGVIIRKADGERTRSENYASYSYDLEALGRTHDVFSQQLVYFKGNPIYYKRLFVDGDTTLLTSESGAGSPGPTRPPGRYTYAEPYELAGLGTAPSTLAFTADEPVDTAGRAPATSTASCDAPTPPPVGAVGDYATLVPAQPYRASRSIGLVRVTPTPSADVRPAAKVTATVKVLGWTLWSRTLTTDGTLVLPKPYPYLPQTVELRVTPTATAEDATPAPLIQRSAVYTTRW